jgi:hypothetical protein
MCWLKLQKLLTLIVQKELKKVTHFVEQSQKLPMHTFCITMLHNVFSMFHDELSTKTKAVCFATKHKPLCLESVHDGGFENRFSRTYRQEQITAFVLQIQHRDTLCYSLEIYTLKKRISHFV